MRPEDRTQIANLQKRENYHMISPVNLEAKKRRVLKAQKRILLRRLVDMRSAWDDEAIVR
jgi:hypothetical protein